MRRSRRVGVLWGEDLSFFAVLVRLVRWRESRREGTPSSGLRRLSLHATVYWHDPFDVHCRVSKQNPN